MEEHIVSQADALRYFDAGWPVLELPARAKEPPPTGRTGYDGVDATRDEVAAGAWSGNIGLRMPVGVIGIDIDAYHGGLVTLDALKHKLGPLPLTWVSHSNRADGSGIAFFLVPAGLFFVHSLAGIEIVQRHHRYALAWPSLHPEGRRYDWQDEREDVVDLFEPSIPEVDSLPELPWAWIDELQVDGPDPDAPHTRPVAAAARDVFLADHTTVDAPGWLERLVVPLWREQIASGHARHDSMQHKLLWAMEHVRGGVIAGVESVRVLHDEWDRAQRANDLPLRRAGWQREFEAMLRHAIAKVEAAPQDRIDRLHDEAAGFRVGLGATSAAAPAPAVLDVYQPPSSVSPALPSFINWTAFVHRDATPQDWLVEHFWPWGRSMAVWGDAKSGKSELALWCACKLALGEHPWTGAPMPPLDVAYFDYEMSPDDLDDRLSEFDIDPLTLVHLHYMQLPPLHPLDSDAGGQAVASLVESVGAKAVVIDTMIAAVAGEENRADTSSAFTRFTGNRLKAMGVGYLRIDHAGKDRTKGARGSSAKRGDVDIVWAQYRTARGVALDCRNSSRVSWVPPKLELDRTTSPQGVIGYALPVTLGGYSSEAIAKARELQSVGVPTTASRREAAAALKAKGLTAGKTIILGEALKCLAEMRPQPGTTPGTTLPQKAGEPAGEPAGNQAADDF